MKKSNLTPKTGLIRSFNDHAKFCFSFEKMEGGDIQLMKPYMRVLVQKCNGLIILYFLINCL